MKALKIYQCSHCGYIGMERNVKKHEAVYCTVKYFDKVLEGRKDCRTCKHFYFEGGKHREKTYLCGNGNSKVDLEDLPSSGACQNYELDKEWAEEKKESMKHATAYKTVSLNRPPKHLSLKKKLSL